MSSTAQDARAAESSVRCFWCGSEATSRDHVFPLNLFPRPAPTDLITVPACDLHNGKLSMDEEYFRVLVTAGKAQERPAGQKLWQERVLPRLAQRIGLRRRVIGQIRLANLITPTGLYAGRVSVLEVEWDRVSRVIEKMVRGLYFHHVGERLDGATLSFRHEPVDPFFPIMKKAKRAEVGNGIVRYAYAVTATEPRASLWWILFFDATYFVAATGPEDQAKSSGLSRLWTPRDG